MLARGAMTSAERATEAAAQGELPTVSMPAAKLFGVWAVAAAAAEARGKAPGAVIAIGDCDPRQTGRRQRGGHQATGE
eukprot:5347780-Pleurochrysis_carterae.AAC.1